MKKPTFGQDITTTGNMEFPVYTDRNSARTIGRSIRNLYEDAETLETIAESAIKFLHADRIASLPAFEQFNYSNFKIEQFAYDSKNYYLRIPTGILSHKNKAVIETSPNINLMERQIADHFNFDIDDAATDVNITYEITTYYDDEEKTEPKYNITYTCVLNTLRNDLTFHKVTFENCTSCIDIINKIYNYTESGSYIFRNTMVVRDANFNLEKFVLITKEDAGKHVSYIPASDKFILESSVTDGYIDFGTISELSLTDKTVEVTSPDNYKPLYPADFDTVNLKGANVNYIYSQGYDGLDIKVDNVIFEPFPSTEETNMSMTIKGDVSLGNEKTLKVDNVESSTEDGTIVVNSPVDIKKDFSVSNTDGELLDVKSSGVTLNVKETINGSAELNLSDDDSLKINNSSSEELVSISNTTPVVTVSGTVKATTFKTTSKRELKRDIEPTIHNAVDEINKINIVDFYFKSDTESKERKVGFIADDTDEVFSGSNKDSMDLYNCVGMLLKAVQELSQENKELKEEIEILKDN